MPAIKEINITLLWDSYSNSKHQLSQHVNQSPTQLATWSYGNFKTPYERLFKQRLGLQPNYDNNLFVDRFTVFASKETLALHSNLGTHPLPEKVHTNIHKFNAKRVENLNIAATQYSTRKWNEFIAFAESRDMSLVDVILVCYEVLRIRNQSPEDFQKQKELTKLEMTRDSLRDEIEDLQSELDSIENEITMLRNTLSKS